jgi:predicted nucleotidyltransferase
MSKIKKYTITTQKKEEVVKTISTYLLHHDEIYAAYIFGSFITGRSFADIDLGISIRHEPENVLEYEIELENNLEKLLKLAIDVRILNKAPLSFLQNVIRHGLVIVDCEPNTRSDFESYVLRKYFDFAHFRRRYLSEVINAPI